MSKAGSGVDYKSAPKNYADLHTMYYPYMVNLVSKNGIDDNNKEDVASEIFLRLYERGFLDQFNPDLVFEYQGEARPARFKSFLSRVVTIYVRGYSDRQRRLNRREIQICDLHMGDESSNGFGGGELKGTNWADLYGQENIDHADEVLDKVMEEQDARYLRDWLATRPKRGVHDTCDLVALFDVVRIQLLRDGEYNNKLLREHFGISATTMNNWMRWLKENLAIAYGCQTPPKRARILRPKAGS